MTKKDANRGLYFSFFLGDTFSSLGAQQVSCLGFLRAILLQGQSGQV